MDQTRPRLPLTSVQWGLILVICSAVGFGLNPLLARWADQEGLSSGLTLVYRFGPSGLLLLPYLAPARKHPRSAWMALGLGICMGFGIIGYFKALITLPVAIAVLIFFTYPLFTLLFGVLFYGERLTLISGICAALILVSCLLITSWQEFSPAQLQAVLLCFLAPISLSLLILALVHHLPRLPLLTRIATVNSGQLLVLIPFALFTTSGSLWPSTTQGWLGVLGLATVNSVIPQLMISAGAPLVGAAATAIGGSSELLTSLMIGWWIFQEPMHWQEILGAILVLWALSLTVWESQRQARSVSSNHTS